MHNLSMMTFPSPPPHVWHPLQGHGPGFGEQVKVNLLLPSQELNSTDFFQILQNPLHMLPVHDVIHIPKSTFLSGTFILTSVNDKSAPRAQTPALKFAPNQPMCWAERFSAQPNPKARYIKRNPSAIILQQFKVLFIHFLFMNISYLPNPSAWAGYDTRSIFKGSLTGFNSEFSFS